MSIVKTVLVDRDGVKVRMNADKFNPKLHTLWGQNKTPEASKASEPKEPEAPENDIPEDLASQYKELTGRAPRKDMTAESVQAKIDEKLAE